MQDDEQFDDGDEPVFDEWHPPVACPECGRASTRFVTRRYERNVYECEICGTEFEAEE